MKLTVSGILALAVVAGLAGTAHAQSSASYFMERLCVTSGGALASSPSFENQVVLGVSAPVGVVSSCHAGVQSSFGFCSVAGEISAPIILEARLNPADALSVDLEWTGAEPTYQVYRDFTAQGVVDPSNLFLETAGCATTDTSAALHDLIFYLVLPKP